MEFLKMNLVIRLSVMTEINAREMVIGVRMQVVYFEATHKFSFNSTGETDIMNIII